MLFIVYSFLTLLASASLTSAHTHSSLPANKTSVLNIKLTALNNTNVLMQVTNNGTSSLRLLNEGTFMDDSPVQKLQVFQAGNGIDFDGIQKQVRTQDLDDDVFTTLEAGSTWEYTVDVAAYHDMSRSGNYTVLSKGYIPYAAEGSNDIKGSVRYESNRLRLSVDGRIASLVTKAIVDRRSAVSDCTGNERNSTVNALAACSNLALAAAKAATNGDVAKFRQYFGSTDAATRQRVAGRLNAISRECASSMEGRTTSHCVDTFDGCSRNTLAYTVPARNFIVNCPLYFNYLAPLTNSCHGQDQATTTLHEMAHAPGVFPPGTDDFAYGFADATALPPSMKVLNADNFALYANALFVNC